MVGKRREEGTKPWELEPGDYCVRVDAETNERVAWVVTPNGNGPARLDGWDLTEHEDGTITVSPSILAHESGNQPYWHGFLERGVWRSC
jgi:Family of unknown function (DUF6527)